MPKDTITVTPNEVALFKLRFRNTGMNDWPQGINLYQVGYSKYSAFNDASTFFKAGNLHCKANAYKFIEIEICAPNEAGTFTYDFCLGTDRDHLFGQTIQIPLNVEGEQIVEPEQREDDADDLEFQNDAEAGLVEVVGGENDFFTRVE